jgi:hypothetical protein
VEPPNVWLVVEEDDEHGTEMTMVLSVHASQASAMAAAEKIASAHQWGGGQDEDCSWCDCCGKDWTIDGPYAVEG